MPPASGAGSAFSGTELACLRGARLVFAGLSFRLEPASALLITGPNGSGKSSLLRLMAGLIRPFAGELAWDGAALAEEPDAHRGRVAYLGHLDAVKPALSALDNLAFWAALAAPHHAQGRAMEALGAFGLGELAAVPGRYLSAGQKRRLALARLLAAPARLWLLDEPTVALDRDGVTRLETAIAQHRAAGGMVALATHTALDLPGAAALRLDDFAVDPDDEPDGEPA